MTCARLAIVRTVICALAALALAAPARGQSNYQYRIDATNTPAPIEAGSFAMGTARSHSGHTIAATSRYLLRDGKPWLPVMAEFHFARYPHEQWDDALLAIKAGGVTVVSSYVFWVQHEEVEGQFDWTGQRDLRAFVERCAAH